MVDYATPRWTSLRPHAEQHRLMFQDSRFKIVPAGRRSGKCLAEDTPILMSNWTYKFVQDVVAGDTVVSLNETTKRIEYKKVSHTISNGIKPVIELVTNTGRLLCTLNHPIFTNRGWVEAGDLKLGEWIGVPINKIGYVNCSFKHLYWEKLIFKGEVGEKPTYDLTVEDNHNFVAGGIFTHNTELAKRYLVLRALNPWDKRLPRPAQSRNPRYFVAAPVYGQAKSIYWNDLKALIPNWAYFPNKRRGISESELTIRLKSGVEIVVVGLDKPERIEGPPWDGCILDEYGNMKSEAWSLHVRPCLSDRNGWAWMIGVPEGRNHYYDIFEDAKAVAVEAKAEGKVPEWDGFHWKSADILPPEEIEQAKKDLDDLSYSQEYEANFVSFHGKAYYPFNPLVHCRSLEYREERDLIFCFDFNVNPGVAVVIQEQPMPEQFQWIERAGQYYQEPVWGTGIIGEVYIPRNSNTPAVCNRLISEYKNHRGRVFCYGDASGGAKGTSKIAGTDWDIIRDIFKNEWNGNVFYRVPKANPRERVRINSVNSRLQSKTGVVRLMVDPNKAPHVVKDFEGVRLLEGGSGEIDKRADDKLTHLTDGAGYYICYEWPISPTFSESREFLI